MLVQPTEDRGCEGLTITGPHPHFTYSAPIPEGSGGNLGSQSSSDKSLSGSEGGLTLQSVREDAHDEGWPLKNTENGKLKKKEKGETEEEGQLDALLLL
ncbi:hypothetical protein Tco_0952423 [Tanacetum coccineum]|uniref:Uncharacterized protein n=1 Tax=Tanacetum coccineum TaxID=301880 RepID=A0ABQ5DZU8_9ASTR